jgi:hypothetical protein
MRGRIGVFQRADAVERFVVVHDLLHAGAVFSKLLRLLLAHLALRDAGIDPCTVGIRKFGSGRGRQNVDDENKERCAKQNSILDHRTPRDEQRYQAGRS